VSRVSCINLLCFGEKKEERKKERKKTHLAKGAEGGNVVAAGINLCG
jgi:hypothetical protein